MGLKLGNKNIGAFRFHKNNGILPSGTLTISSNTGVYDVASYARVKIDIEDLVEKRITEGLSQYNNLSLTRIGIEYAFAGMDIEEINFPECSYITGYAFQDCSNLKTINLPKLDHFGTNAFENCINLNSINLPSCTTLNGGVFENCKKLTTISLPICESM